MSDKKRVGIVGWSLGDNSFGVTKAYLHHISVLGCQPVILTPDKGIDTTLDLVILPGGKDTLSASYNEPPGFYNSDADPHKEYFIRNNLQLYIDAGIPIWGTCLGMQQLVVFFGGRLKQHINVGSHGYSGDDRSEKVHALHFSKEWQWFQDEYNEKRNKGKDKKKQEHYSILTNSLHHQAVLAKELPECFELVAKTIDGVAEIIKHKDLPIAAGQPHVEEDRNVISEYLISWLLEQKNTNNDKALQNTDVQIKEKL